MKTHISRNILLILLSFLGLGALFGGGVFIIGPSGKIFGMPLSMLDHSPFPNFLIPGIILFIILGAVPVLLVIALIKRPISKQAEFLNCYKDMYWAWTFCIYIAFALIVWLQTEMTILRAVHWSHSFYLAIAMAILFVALLPGVRAIYKKEQ
jgi:hypothetical protein